MCVSLVEVMFRMFPTSQPMTVKKINDEISKCLEIWNRIICFDDNFLEITFFAIYLNKFLYLEKMVKMELMQINKKNT